ncbi:hypothetical protein QUB68_02850 [Microcoleus sp. A006_D1]|uniref:hypothetical protein n=1 Tax=Microcoleus sp. A006_D1 TaxID=3055267 RepID=UPI002FD6F383
MTISDNSVSKATKIRLSQKFIFGREVRSRLRGLRSPFAREKVVKGDSRAG